jgi:hypothetical protein
MNLLSETLDNLHALEFDELSTVIIVASTLMRKKSGEDETSNEEGLDRKDTEDYDCDDYDPTAAKKTKKELDLELLIYKIQDPRLTPNERRGVANQISELM